MKPILTIASLSAVLLGACTGPQFTILPTYGELTPEGGAGLVSSGAPNVESSVEDLGLDSSEATPGLRADFRFGAPHLTVSTQKSSWDGSGRLDADFGGINAGADVDSQLDFALHRLLVTFDIVPTDVFELGLGFGVSIADVEAAVRERATSLTESIDERVPIPVLALRAGFRIWRVDLELLLSGIGAHIDGDELDFLDADVNARIAVLGRPGQFNGSLVLGWRHVDLAAAYSDGGDDVDLDLSFRGPYVGLQLGF